MIGDLTWDTDGLGAHRAWSGQLCVGSVQAVLDGKWWFDATYAVRMRDTPGTAPNSGYTFSLEEAKAALTRAWETWLRIADLGPQPDTIIIEYAIVKDGEATVVRRPLRDLPDCVRSIFDPSPVA